MSSLPPGPLDPDHQPSNDRRDEPRLMTRGHQDASHRWSLTHDIAPQRETPLPPPSRTPRRSPGKLRRFRFLLKTAIGCAILAIVAILVTALLLRHSMHTSLPQIEGTLHISGLSAPVNVARDDHGVPSITGANLDDVLFAQGFVTAQDRLWQMDGLRRHAAGELAEILGSSMVKHDRTQRTLQLRTAAEHAIAAMPADQIHQLEAYARGVNAFIAENDGHLPVEFHILHYKPAPWEPRDSILIALAMAQDLSTEYPTKMLRESFSAHMPTQLLGDLYPVGSWRDHPPAQAVPDLTSPRPEIEQIPLDESQSKLELPSASPSELLGANDDLFLQTCESCRSGSNNWAVNGARSASGAPVLSNDMHLSLGVPGIWYETALHTADHSLDVTGLSLPGTPFIIVGRNAHVAWGFTSLGADVQDVYIEHTRGSGSSLEFQRADGSWSPVVHHNEHIRVRGGMDVSLDVMTTTHNVGSVAMATPIISGLYPSEQRTLSLAWTVYDPANLSDPFAAVNMAPDGAGLVAALGNWGVPSLNLVYADDHNHIGFQAIGRVPVRGPAVHHPIIAAPDDIPVDAQPAPENEEEGARLSSPNQTPIFVEAMYRPRRRRARIADAPEQTPAPRVEEAPIAPVAEPLGYTIGSAIPAVPVDARDLNAQWSGYIPYNELPSVIDPASGIVATANSRIAPDGYPYAITLDWAAPYRAERITHVLAASSGFTPADSLRLEMDVHSELDLALAQRMAYAIDRSTKPSKRLREAADILRKWNGNVDTDAPAAAIVSAARAELIPMLLIPQIEFHDRGTKQAKAAKPEDIADMYTWGEQGYALELLVQHTPARWLPHGFANWDDLLATAVDRGLTSAHAPSNLAKWSYSSTHPVELSHPLLSNPLLSRLLGVKAGSGKRVIAGDTSCIKSTGHAFGPSERFTADLGNPSATTSNITTGQSGNPSSPWYLDQLPHWLDGTTLPQPLNNAKPAHVLTLAP